MGGLITREVYSWGSIVTPGVECVGVKKWWNGYLRISILTGSLAGSSARSIIPLCMRIMNRIIKFTTLAPRDPLGTGPCNARHPRRWSRRVQ